MLLWEQVGSDPSAYNSWIELTIFMHVRNADKGSIFIVLLSALLLAEFDDAEKRASLVLKRHTGPVTCLWCPDPKELGGSKLLVSGGADCSVRVWNVE